MRLPAQLKRGGRVSIRYTQSTDNRLTAYRPATETRQESNRGHLGCRTGADQGSGNTWVLPPRSQVTGERSRPRQGRRRRALRGSLLASGAVRAGCHSWFNDRLTPDTNPSQPTPDTNPSPASPSPASQSLTHQQRASSPICLPRHWARPCHT